LRAGLPLVTTDVGGLSALVGDAAVVVPVGDAGALRRAVERVLTDKPERERLVAAGHAQAARWPDEKANVDEVAQHYLEVIDQCGRR
jgi:glycosyltransferase involved in cell wall biosynthesis